MQESKKGSLPYFTHPALDGIPCLGHAVFTRQGGLSKPPYDTLNLGIYTEDSAVKDNFALIEKSFDLSHIKYPKLTHGDEVLVVNHKDFPCGKEADALITNLINTPLLVTHADCQAAIIVDPVQKALGVVHAGWRGNLQKIYTRTIEKMQKHFQTNPKDLLVGLSPSLGPLHSTFDNYKNEFPESYWHYKDEQNRFDLWKIAEDELIDAGIYKQNTHIAGICTYQSDLFFSYRKDHLTGRNATLAWLKN